MRQANLARQIFDGIQWFCRISASATNTVFEAIRQISQITACEKVCRQTLSFYVCEKRRALQRLSKCCNTYHTLTILAFTRHQLWIFFEDGFKFSWTIACALNVQRSIDTLKVNQIFANVFYSVNRIEQIHNYRLWKKSP